MTRAGVGRVGIEGRAWWARGYGAAKGSGGAWGVWGGGGGGGGGGPLVGHVCLGVATIAAGHAESGSVSRRKFRAARNSVRWVRWSSQASHVLRRSGGWIFGLFQFNAHTAGLRQPLAEQIGMSAVTLKVSQTLVLSHQGQPEDGANRKERRRVGEVWCAGRPRGKPPGDEGNVNHEFSFMTRPTPVPVRPNRAIVGSLT
jgi:hypothetical protein